MKKSILITVSVAVLAGAGLGVCGGTAMLVIVGLAFSLVVS